ncbi:pentapeptide repeat-containing protein [Mycolicibacterium sp.]|uniref:pentapeptide repeat-containing protein n=1 Tax=Mycolicibacterium sp. TaxID=2320850 RepID=UPI0037C6CA8B
MDPAESASFELNDAERRAVAAAKAGSVCILSPTKEPSSDAQNSKEARTIRAEILALLLTNAYPGMDVERVILKGANIVGKLKLDERLLVSTYITHCEIEDASFTNATFVGEVSFSHTTFLSAVSFSMAQLHGRSRFNHAKFQRGAHFSGCGFQSGATFAHADFGSEASFDTSEFSGAADFTDTIFNGWTLFTRTTFKGPVDFNDSGFIGTCTFKNALFHKVARFKNTTFATRALFAGAAFCEDAHFHDAVFSGSSGFNNVEFTGTVRFYRAKFAVPVSFKEAQFRADARFNACAFATEAQFLRTLFEGDVTFKNAYARFWNFRGSIFSKKLDSLVGVNIDLTRCHFDRRTKVSLATDELLADWLIAKDGIHLEIFAQNATFSDAEFHRDSIIEGVTSTYLNRDLSTFTEHKGSRSASIAAARADVDRTISATASTLSTIAGGQLGTHLISLQRANVGNLSVSAVDLSRCAFSGAYGLDKIRTDYGCKFRFPPRRLRARVPVWPTQRRMIYEELLWRRLHLQGWGERPMDPDAVPDALEVASLYRALRKGTEDAKNEPGAADFYYGEMEMRRLAGRGKPSKSSLDASPPNRPTVERSLIWAYWIISGYGLRASRAVIALCALIFVSAALFTSPAFSSAPPAPQQGSAVSLGGSGASQPGTLPASGPPNYWQAVTFSMREGLSILRPSGTEAIRTHGPGILVDFVIRLAAPVLLALALLAVRARTKR